MFNIYVSESLELSMFIFFWWEKYLLLTLPLVYSTTLYKLFF